MVSILIVSFNSQKELKSCVRSIKKTSPKISYEIILRDNTKDNIGYGAGNNKTAKKALGKYLFILNPDTVVHKNTIDNLVAYLESHKDAGIAAPQLFDKNGKFYLQLGVGKLDVFTGIVVLSFLNKIFPKNYVSQKYWGVNRNWDINQKVETVAGSAFMIRKKLFEKVNGFDENFFLYFEEVDLCNRVRKLNINIVILPNAKITHFWGKNKKGSHKLKSFFEKSRFYYFKKNYGVLPAILVGGVARIGKSRLWGAKRPR